MIIYGSSQCPDTKACLNAAQENKLLFDFRDIAELPFLKEFLAFRDHSPVFEPVKAAGGIGIPFIIRDDGSQSFEL